MAGPVVRTAVLGSALIFVGFWVTSVQLGPHVRSPRGLVTWLTLGGLGPILTDVGEAVSALPGTGHLCLWLLET